LQQTPILSYSTLLRFINHQSKDFSKRQIHCHRLLSLTLLTVTSSGVVLNLQMGIRFSVDGAQRIPGVFEMKELQCEISLSYFSGIFFMNNCKFLTTCSM